MAKLSEHGIRLSSMSPTFLNSNSTSHTRPFSAVAELIDNAADPGVSAKQIWIDVTDEAGQTCLTFTDNGSGMTPNKLHKMLSFGFTEKGSGKASQQAIGVYGNGFKSGSMRLGRDALIFTKNGGCQTVGMLSQTYLANIKAQAVIVPIVPFNQQTKSLVVTEDSEASLAAILQHSILTSQEQIHAHFDSIPSKKGTKILIWNIRRANDAKMELDFETDISDFRLPKIQIEELKKGLKNSGAVRAEQSLPDLHYSLRAYLSILYLKPRTQIILRGKKILAKLVSRRLSHTEHDVYKPQFSKEKVKVTFGLNPKSKDHYGIMMYHRNRLIKAYEKVGCQLKTSGQRAGVGVVGVIECNFLKPAHNKQDFEYTKEYRLTLGALGLKLNDYWKEVTEKKAREREFQSLDRDEDEDEDKHDADESPMWVQCEECLKWRSVPAHHYGAVPESWTCSQNPNPRYRSCSSPEEAEESEEQLTPSYQKNHKKQEHLRTRRRERSLETCDLQDQKTKHQTLSRSASEPGQLTLHSTHTPEHGRADADTHTCHDKQMQTQLPDEVKYMQQLTGRDSAVEDEILVKSKEKRSTSENETHERQAASTDTVSRKRKFASLFDCLIKKPYVWEEQQADSKNTAEEMSPEKQTSSLDKAKQDCSNRGEKQGDAVQQAPPCLPWAHSLSAAQTVVVSPLSRTEVSRPLPPEGSDREAKVQKLAALEKEAQRLRTLLDLETSTMTQGTMTEMSGDCHDELEPSASTARTEVGCQADVAEGSASSSITTQSPLVQDQRSVCAPEEQPEQNRARKEKNEVPIRTRDSGACEDGSTQENLHDLRHNVVILLTALLPQLDLAGISLETTDVDNILQQIIEVNSLKL